MSNKGQFKKAILSICFIFTLLLNSIPVAYAQGGFVTTNRIGGGSSVYVFRTSRKAKKSNYAAKRRTKARRTKKQRRVTRRKIVRQTRRVAKRYRKRRTIKKVTPKQLEKINIKTISKAEASKVFAGTGEYYVERDEFEKAVQFLEQAVELNPNNNDAKLALSEVRTVLGNKSVDQAEDYAILAAKALKEKREADVEKYLTKEHFAFKKAENDFLSAIKLDPKNSTAYASLGQYYDDKNEDEKAIENYKKAIAIDDSLSYVKAPLGLHLYQKGEIAEAEKLFTEALKDGVESAEMQYFYGLILYKKQTDDKEAKIALQKSLSLDNENAEAHYYLGAVSNRLKEYDRAIESFKRATDFDPTFVLAWFDLGVVYYNQGQYDQAIAAFDKAIKLNKNQNDEEKKVRVESHANLAEAYRQKNQPKLAIPKYRFLVGKVNNDPELFSTFGFVLAGEKFWRESITTFDKVVQMKPDSVSYGNLGWAHYQESQFHASWNRKSQQRASLQKAKDALQKAIDQDSEFVAPYLNLGYTLNDLGEHDEAVKVLKKASKMRKDWVLTENALGIAYHGKGDLDKAAKHFQKAIKLDKNYASAYYGLGEVEFKRGKRKEADKALAKLSKLDTKLARILSRKIEKGAFN